MDHAEAIAANTTDRYLLGELTAAEADAFEEHYFDCAHCAEELRIGAHFVDGARRLGRESLAPAGGAPVVSLDAARARRAGWIPAAAAAVLLLALGAPLLMKWRSDAAAPAFEVADQHSFLLSGARGEDASTLSFNGKAPVVLFVDVPAEPAYRKWEARLLRPEGDAIVRALTPSPEGEPIPLVVRGLRPGTHQLVLVGISSTGDRTEIARHRFVVRR